MTSLFEEIHPDRPADVPVRRVTITLNGERRAAEIEPRLLLAHLIRQGFRLTGTHTGCDTSNCGACTVLMDGQIVSSCLTLAVRADGTDITTIEGLAQEGRLHPVQQAFIDYGGFQCGICTPGMIMAAQGLLQRNRTPTDAEIKRAISGNLCRCTGYVNIVRAIQAAAIEVSEED